MAEATDSERVFKQRWAEPGSGHDQLVRWAKIILPSAVGILLAILAVAPLEKKGDVSFILDKKKVQNAPERFKEARINLHKFWLLPALPITALV